jgi:hypothetical protein
MGVPASQFSAARRYNAVARHHGPDSDQARAAFTDLELARCRAAIERLLGTAPELTRDQLDDLAALLRPGGVACRPLVGGLEDCLVEGLREVSDRAVAT